MNTENNEITDKIADTDATTEVSTVDAAESKPRKHKPKIAKEVLESLAIQPHRCASAVVIPGDSTEEGQRYAGTSLDDLRQNLPWSDTHETILRGILANATFIPNPENRDVEIAVNKGAPVSVYVIGDGTNYHLVIENGRQRTRITRELNDRLEFVAQWCASHPEYVNVQARRKALLSEKANRPWIDENFVYLVFGTTEFGEASKRSWITVDKDKSTDPPTVTFSPVKLYLTLSVVGQNPSLTDNNVLLGMIARQDNTVKTPRSIRAANIDRMMKPDGNGNRLSAESIGRLTNCSADTVQNDVRFLMLIPEVQAAIENGIVSQTVVLSGAGRKAGCLFTKVDGSLVPLAEDQQRAIWTALLGEYPADSEGNPPRIYGEKAVKLGLKIQKAILDGKSWGDAKNEPEAVPPPVADASQDAPSDAPQASQSSQTAPSLAPVKTPKGKAGKVDYARLGEHLNRALAKAEDPTESGLTDSVIVSRTETRAALSAALATIAFIGGDKTALKDVPPALREALLSALADAEPAHTPASVKAQSDDLLYVAAIDALDSDPDFGVDALSALVSVGKLSDGSTACAEAIAHAQSEVASIKAGFEAQSEYGKLYDYMLANFASA